MVVSGKSININVSRAIVNHPHLCHKWMVYTTDIWVVYDIAYTLPY
jgi:hypothetical protein